MINGLRTDLGSSGGNGATTPLMKTAASKARSNSRGEIIVFVDLLKNDVLKVTTEKAAAVHVTAVKVTTVKVKRKKLQL
jgi:hypothetical protein